MNIYGQIIYLIQKNKQVSKLLLLIDSSLQIIVIFFIPFENLKLCQLRPQPLNNKLMSYHLIQNIFINLPITVAYQRLWQLLLSADGLQAFNHYFKTNTVVNKKSNQFQRQILLRIPQKIQVNTINQDISQNTTKITQKVTKIDQQKKILYQTIKSQEKQSITGDFFHQFQQNNKGEVYLIFASSCRKGIKCIPQLSQVQIQLIKIKDLIQNQGAKFDKDKRFFKKCC